MAKNTPGTVMQGKENDEILTIDIGTIFNATGTSNNRDDKELMGAFDLSTNDLDRNSISLAMRLAKKIDHTITNWDATLGEYNDKQKAEAESVGIEIADGFRIIKTNIGNTAAKGGSVYVGDKKLEKEIAGLINGDGFSEDEKKNFLAAFNNRQQENKKTIYDTRLTKEDKEIAKFKNAALLYTEVEMLRSINKRSEELKKAKEDLEKIKKTRDEKTAGKIDPSKIANEDILKNKDKTQLYYRQGPFAKNAAEVRIADLENNIREKKEALEKIIKGNDVINGKQANFADTLRSKDPTKLVKKNATSTIYEAAKKLIRQTPFREISAGKATRSSKWHDFLDYEQNLLNDIRNSEKLDNNVKKLAGKIMQQDGFNKEGQEELNGLMKKFMGEAIKGADNKHTDYLEKLQKKITEINDKILEEIDKDLKEDDKLHKLRMVQASLLICFLCPALPIANVFFSFLEPLIGGEMGLADFMANILSTDGPLGDLAWITDKMELDSLTRIIFGDLLGGPVSLVENTVFNGVTTPIFESAGGAFAGSPLAPLAMMCLTEGLSGYSGKELDRMEKSSKILPDAKKSLDKEYQNLIKEEEERIEKQDEQFSKNYLQFKKDLFVANKAANWLKGNFDGKEQNQQFIKDLINKFAGEDNKAKAGELIKALESGQNIVTFLSDKENKEFLDFVLKARELDLNIEQNEVNFNPRLSGQDVMLLEDGERIANDKNFKSSLRESAEDGTTAINLDECFNEDGSLKNDFADSFFDGGDIKDSQKLIKFNLEGQDRYFDCNSLLSDGIDADAFSQNLQKVVTNLKTVQDSDALKKKINKDRSQKVENIFEATKSVEDKRIEEIKKDLDSDVMFCEAEKRGVEHNHLPAKARKMFVDERLKELTECIIPVSESEDQEKVTERKELHKKINKLCLDADLEENIYNIGLVGRIIFEDKYSEFMEQIHNGNYDINSIFDNLFKEDLTEEAKLEMKFEARDGAERDVMLGAAEIDRNLALLKTQSTNKDSITLEQAKEILQEEIDVKIQEGEGLSEEGVIKDILEESKNRDKTLNDAITEDCENNLIRAMKAEINQTQEDKKEDNKSFANKVLEEKESQKRETLGH